MTLWRPLKLEMKNPSFPIRSQCLKVTKYVSLFKYLNFRAKVIEIPPLLDDEFGREKLDVFILESQRL